MKYDYNGWFVLEANTREEAQSKLKDKLINLFSSYDGIRHISDLNGSWKKYSFHGLFNVNARSVEEALKRAQNVISRDGILISEDEENDEDSDIEKFTVDVGYLTEDDGDGILEKFTMTNGDKTKAEICHAVSAKDAWDSLRSDFIYDEHVILMQNVRIPCVVSPKWRVFDSYRDQKTPDYIEYQAIVALGFAGESWWGNNRDIIKPKDGFISARPIHVLS